MINNFYLWFVMLFLILFFMWFMYGGKQHDFIGLEPLKSEYKLKDNLDKLPQEEADKIEILYEEENVSPEDLPSETEFPQNQGYRQKSRGETICKKCLEIWFRSPFNTVRNLRWLKNPDTGSMLELDCYNPEFRLAVERNGIQHYEYPNRFHKSEAEFNTQVQRDIFKKIQCDKNGIYLIIVPYTVSEKEIPEFIRRKLPAHLRNLASLDSVKNIAL